MRFLINELATSENVLTTTHVIEDLIRLSGETPIKTSGTKSLTNISTVFRRGSVSQPILRRSTILKYGTAMLLKQKMPIHVRRMDGTGISHHQRVATSWLVVQTIVIRIVWIMTLATMRAAVLRDTLRATPETRHAVAQKSRRRAR